MMTGDAVCQEPAEGAQPAISVLRAARGVIDSAGERFERRARASANHTLELRAVFSEIVPESGEVPMDRQTEHGRELPCKVCDLGKMLSKGLPFLLRLTGERVGVGRLHRSSLRSRGIDHSGVSSLAVVLLDAGNGKWRRMRVPERGPT